MVIGSQERERSLLVKPETPVPSSIHLPCMFQRERKMRRDCMVMNMGTRRPFLQDGESRGSEAVDHVAHSLVVAPKLARDGGGALPTRRGSQDLAATQHKGIRRTQSRLDPALFVFGERSNKNGCSHAL